ncbi:MAG: hypothetical protein RI928_2124 [Pseudomonadota bacterium]|jgi:predicted HAD superfamily hydrolase
MQKARVKFKEKNFVYEDLIGEFPEFTNEEEVEDVYMAIFDDVRVYLYSSKSQFVAWLNTNELVHLIEQGKVQVLP